MLDSVTADGRRKCPHCDLVQPTNKLGFIRHVAMEHEDVMENLAKEFMEKVAKEKENEENDSYDTNTKEFLLGHGGKSNIVRLNDKPLISNETLKTGDLIRIGETVLRFVALCDGSFDWDNGTNEEDEDVAIA